MTMRVNRLGIMAALPQELGDLIESSDGIANVSRVGQRLFPVVRKGKDAVGQVAFRRKLPMFLVRRPGRLHWELPVSFLKGK